MARGGPRAPRGPPPKKITREARGPIPGGPGGPYEESRASSAPNGATATHFVDLFIFWYGDPNQDVLCPQRNPAGGRRAVAPTRTPLASTHPPKIAIPLLGGDPPFRFVLQLLSMIQRRVWIWFAVFCAINVKG